MTMPQFTAEASLFRARGQYRPGVLVNKLPTKTIGQIYPAREMEEEIHVHSYALDWTDIGGTCWPHPLTEPSGGGSAGGDGMHGAEVDPTEHYRMTTPLMRMVALYSHNCVRPRCPANVVEG
jgi:hypothetical protein